MKVKLNLLFLSLGILLCSCNCDKKYNCGQISSDAQLWLNLNQSDTVKFVNANQEYITFHINSKKLSDGYESKPCKKGELGCSCDYICNANFYSEGRSDSTFNNQNIYFIRIDETTENSGKNTSSRVLQYSILDFRGHEINLMNSTATDYHTTFYPTLQIGIHNYSNVFTQSIDTLNPLYLTTRIWKTYYAKGYGILGFEDRITHSLYLKE